MVLEIIYGKRPAHSSSLVKKIYIVLFKSNSDSGHHKIRNSFQVAAYTISYLLLASLALFNGVHIRIKSHLVRRSERKLVNGAKLECAAGEIVQIASLALANATRSAS